MYAGSPVILLLADLVDVFLGITRAHPSSKTVSKKCLSFPVRPVTAGPQPITVKFPYVRLRNSCSLVKTTADVSTYLSADGADVLLAREDGALELRLRYFAGNTFHAPPVHETFSRHTASHVEDVDET